MSVCIDQILTKYTSLLSLSNFDKNEFLELKKKFKRGDLSESKNIEERKISAPSQSSILKIRKSNKLREVAVESIRKNEVGYLIMNGGMATRFGGEVKGLIPVFSNKNFLSLKLEAIFKLERELKGKIPVFIMNSFQTGGKTETFLKNKYCEKDIIYNYNQSISIRLNQHGDIYFNKLGEPLFYAPGHGDLVQSFKRSGFLDRFIKNNGKYLIVSNVDNVLATVDLSILGYHIESRKQMTTEVARLYKNDKGGAPVLINDRIEILEAFRFPVNFDWRRLHYFNTNTFIFSTGVLLKDYNLSWFVIEKEVDSARVIQFEKLIGELSHFVDSNYIEVSRRGKNSRFLPVKTREDLDRNREKLERIIKPRL